MSKDNGWLIILLMFSLCMCAWAGSERDKATGKLSTATHQLTAQAETLAKKEAAIKALNQIIKDVAEERDDLIKVNERLSNKVIVLSGRGL